MYPAHSWTPTDYDRCFYIRFTHAHANALDRHGTYVPITLAGASCINKACEGCNDAFFKLVGVARPTVWRTIDSVRKDQCPGGLLACYFVTSVHGQRPAKRVRPSKFASP